MARSQPSTAIGTGQVKVALILPLSAGGNAGIAALSMKNAAEMALAEFNSPNIQLLVKDDAGTPGGASQAAQQALSEGAELIVGPLFAQSVQAVGQVARTRGVPVIAFSTDVSVAARGTYLLSFLPESDVDRIVDFAVANGKRSYAAMVPENAYGSVVEAALQQIAARKGARIVALERYQLGSATQLAAQANIVAQSAQNADAIFIPDGSDAVPNVVSALIAAGRADEEHPVARHRAVGRSAHLQRQQAARRVVRRARFRRLPEFLGALSHPVRPGSGPHRDAVL